MTKIKCSNFAILAKAGIHAGSGKMPLEEMDSRIRGKDNDIFVMYYYFPIQKLENIFPSKSSAVKAPVISQSD